MIDQLGGDTRVLKILLDQLGVFFVDFLALRRSGENTQDKCASQKSRLLGHRGSLEASLKIVTSLAEKCQPGTKWKKRMKPKNYTPLVPKY